MDVQFIEGLFFDQMKELTLHSRRNEQQTEDKWLSDILTKQEYLKTLSIVSEPN